MSNPTVGIDITARLDHFRAELEKARELGGDAAKDIMRQLTREVKAAEKASREAAKAAKDLRSSYQVAGDTFGKVGQNSSKMAGLLGLISPRAAEAARTLNDVGDAGEALTAGAEGAGLSLGVVGAGLAGVAAVIGVVALGYEGLTAASEAQARADKIVSDGLASTREQLVGTRRSLLEARLATEGATSAEKARALGLYDADQAYRKATAGARELIEANNKLLAPETLIPESWAEGTGLLSKAMGDLAEEIDRVDGGIDGLAVKGGLFSFITTGIDGLTDSTKDLQRESYLRLGTMVQERGATILAAAATEKARLAQEAATEAERKRREGIEASKRALAEMRSEEQAAAAAYGGALDFLDGQIKGNRLALLTGEARSTAEHEAALQALRDQRDLAVATAATEDGEATAHAAFLEAKASEDARYYADVAKLRQDAEEKTAARMAKELDDQKRMAAEVRGYWSETGNAVVRLSDGVTSAHVDAVSRLEAAEQQARDSGEASRARSLGKAIQMERQAAQDSFAFSQGAQLALAAMNAVQAEMNVIATVPFPATIPAAISVGAIAAADIAAIASAKPPFHAGGLEGNDTGGPDESWRRFLDGEAALSRTGRRMIGDDAIIRANSGRPVAAAVPLVQANVSFGHRHFDKFIRRNVSRRGSYLGQRFDGDRNIGRGT